MSLFRSPFFVVLAVTAASFGFPQTAFAIDRSVIVNDSSLSDPIGVGFGHWEGVEPLRIRLEPNPGEIETADMFALEAVAWRATDKKKPDPWIFETAAIKPDEAFAVQFAGTLAVPPKEGKGKGGGGGGDAAPPPEWAVAVPDIDIDADGVPDEKEFSPPGSEPNAQVGLGLVIGQSNPVTITVHPKVAGSLRLTTTNAGVVEVFESADWPAGQPTALPYQIQVDATRTLSFVVRGHAEGEATLVARFVPDKKGGAGGDTNAVDRLTVKVAPLFVDLDVDSNNNGTIADNDDPIEDDESLPGKVLIVNRLDYTGEGIPGYANGMDHLNHAGDGKSNSFTEMILRIPDVIDRNKATITFSYSGATPKSVIESPGNQGRHKVHDPGTDKHVRVWTKDGHTSRLVADISANVAGHFVTPDQPHKVKAVFGGTSESEISLWVEGINESDAGAARISVTLDAGGAGDPQFQADDHVRLTSAWLQLVFTDVTSPDGIGDTAATDVPRIPKEIEADGIACDWQPDVNDGAMLVMRVIGSPILWDFLQDSALDIKFGHIVNKAFEDLPVSGREGQYLTWPRHHPLVLDQPGALTGLGIEKPGEDFGSSLKVLDARFYRPPDEFDLDTPLNPSLERKVNLAIRLNEQKPILKYRGSKPHAIALVRAPLVLVHGVNPHPRQWIKEDPNALGSVFHNSYGFRCLDFLVNHRGPDPDPSRSIEGDTLGFGEISSVYTKVRDKVTSPNGADDAATDSFRSGKKPYFIGFDGRPASESGKRIAVQKVDIIAHSYGGLLTRWYIEKAAEFGRRRDVRKLITLGTPHRGSPLANVVCEVFKRRLIGHAGSAGVANYRPTMIDLLAGLDTRDFGRDTFPFPLQGFLRGALPTALDLPRTRPRHAYQVFSMRSERLAELNDVAGGRPFHDDVGYAAIVGRNESLYDVLEPFDAFQPVWRINTTDFSRPYWPWLAKFNNGTDAIVPAWSARLGVPGFNEEVNVNHIGMDATVAINNIVRNWLNTSVPRGGAHRAGFASTTPISERNAYEGSVIGGSGASTGAGLKDAAIVAVRLGNQEVASPFEFPGVFGTQPSEVGLRPIVLTGMIRRGQIGSEPFTITAIHGTDRDLHAMGALAAAQLHVPASDLFAAAADDYVTFHISSGRLGRRYSNRLIGPTGHSDEDNNALVVYQTAEIPGGQSPPARASVPAFSLPAPTKGGQGNLEVSVAGAVEAKGVGGAQPQKAEVALYHDNLISDTLLEVLGHPPAAAGAKVPVPHPALVFDGLLLPYSETATLTVVEGQVSGAAGSSGANPANVYQKLEDHSVSSTSVAVP